MKKVKIALLAALSFAGSAFAQITDPSPYCAAGYDDAAGMFPLPHYITNVTLGTLNNTTGSSQYPGQHYAYYNAVTAPSLTAGSTYSLSVGNDGGATIHFLAVYIDYNHNNSFADVGERVLEQHMGAVSNPAIASITIPAGATAGITRMRVMVFEDDNYTLGGAAHATPCTGDATGSLDWGETEDYNVNIIAASSTTAPVAGFKVNTATGTTATVFNFTDTSMHTPTSRKWTFAPATVAYQTGSTDVSANPSVKFTATGNYTVKLVVSNAAGKDSVTKTNFIKVTATTGIGGLAGSDEISLYPNPAKNWLYITGNLDGAEIQLIDVQGRQQQATSIAGNRIDISKLPSGIYFVRIIKEDLSETKVLSIQQ